MQQKYLPLGRKPSKESHLPQAVAPLFVYFPLSRLRRGGWHGFGLNDYADYTTTRAQHQRCFLPAPRFNRKRRHPERNPGYIWLTESFVLLFSL